MQYLDKKVHTSELPELERSFMKVLDGEVDKSSPSYQQNLEEMMKKNEELDKITSE